MSKQEIVVIGASAGGVEALKILASGLPQTFASPILVVLHIGRGIDGRTFLPEILTRVGPLPARVASDYEELRPGRIYVAPPDCHMSLFDGRIRVRYGPKENRTRPAINPLFRTAAAAYGASVTGVILSGLQDDGVAGLAAIKRRGGLAVVQDPSTALFPSMPQNAIKHVDADYIVPLDEIACLLSRLSGMERMAKETCEPVEKQLTEIKCPECTGPLWEERCGRIIEYRCRVGHAFSPLALREEQQEAVERALWTSVISLEDAALAADKLADELGPDSAQDVQLRREQADSIKQMLPQSEPSDE